MLKLNFLFTCLRDESQGYAGSQQAEPGHMQTNPEQDCRPAHFERPHDLQLCCQDFGEDSL